jgi:hypothetical protein
MNCLQDGLPSPSVALAESTVLQPRPIRQRIRALVRGRLTSRTLGSDCPPIRFCAVLSCLSWLSWGTTKDTKDTKGREEP